MKYASEHDFVNFCYAKSILGANFRHLRQCIGNRMTATIKNDWQLYDQPWSAEKINLLVNGFSVRKVESNGVEHLLETTSDGYYGARLRAIDHGDYDAVLDCIQLDNAIKEHVTDDSVAAALTLRLAGWHPASIGGVIRDKKHRPGARMVADGIMQVALGERRKRYEVEAREKS